MTIKDIITLANKGYKPGDIKDLLELGKDVDIAEITKENEAIHSDTLQESATETIENNMPVADIPEEKPDEPDYKTLYEKTKTELESIQKINVKRDISTEDDYLSDEDILKNLLKDFTK